MIDPRRKRQNEERAAKLLAFQDELTDRLWERDPRAWRLIDAIGRASNRRRPRWPSFEDPKDFIASNAAFEAADELRGMSVRPLHEAISSRRIVFTVDGREYTPRKPLPWVGHNYLNLIAPLTWHVCTELLIALGELTILINDPSSGAPLSIERPHYASQQTELIRVESSLWELASEYGGPTDRIPYAYRLLLLLLAWDPVAHKAPGGAWTLCVRCGALLHRKRPFDAIPRCPACMKESANQREWPPHAIAPHRQGTWLLRCVYPGCGRVFEGPRQRKLCDDHTSSRLPPKRRLAARLSNAPKRRQRKAAQQRSK